MLKKSLGLTALILLASLPGYSQGIDERVGKLILKDLALLDKLKEDSKADSISLVAFREAQISLQKALEQSQKATASAEKLANDYKVLGDEYLKNLEKSDREIRRQKFYKWVAIVVGGILVAVSQ